MGLSEAWSNLTTVHKALIIVGIVLVIGAVIGLAVYAFIGTQSAEVSSPGRATAPTNMRILYPVKGSYIVSWTAPTVMTVSYYTVSTVH